MCGIVGLLIKKPALRAQLGELMLPMLIGMTERGPDSAGMAVFTEPLPKGRHKLSLYVAQGQSAEKAGQRDTFTLQAHDWAQLLSQVQAGLDPTAELHVKANHAVLTISQPIALVKNWLLHQHPELHVLSAGSAIDLYKDVGLPASIAERYQFNQLQGSHLVGHTRMATESAVTPENAHPYTAGEDFCLVHNGSLSNPYQIRKRLEPLGITFDGDCDTEAACRYLEWRMREGDDLEQALHQGFEVFDGFYTFLMGTADKLALVRDPFACKPAVVAETEDYVAISSEFRSLARLPGVKHANLFEPKPAHIYSWSIHD